MELPAYVVADVPLHDRPDGRLLDAQKVVATSIKINPAAIQPRIRLSILFSI
jgi:hypothetical protein